MTTDLLDVDSDLRTITTYVDGAEVTVQVQTYDVGQTQIRVAAKRYLVYSDEVAASVRDGLVRDLRCPHHGTERAVQDGAGLTATSCGRHAARR